MEIEEEKVAVLGVVFVVHWWEDILLYVVVVYGPLRCSRRLELDVLAVRVEEFVF